MPSALLARCEDSLPVPPEIARDREVSPRQLLQITVAWGSAYHYCRGRHDTLIDYIRERQSDGKG